MHPITPCLWFDTQAEDAAAFYTSVFDNSRIVSRSHYGAEGPREAGMVMTVEFELDGVPFTALNGGPEFTFDEAISFQVDAPTQADIDRFWSALSEGGEEGPCGWLKDRFGVSWQIVPMVLMNETLADPDPSGPAAPWRRCSRWASSTSPPSARPPTAPDGAGAGCVRRRTAVRWPDRSERMMAIARARVERIEFRTTPEVRRVVERAVEASGTNLTDFAESSLVLAAQRVMADRDRFVLSDRAAAEWDAINARPSRDLRGLRALMERPSPYDG